MRTTRLIALGAIVTVLTSSIFLWRARHRPRPSPPKPVPAIAAVFQGSEITLTGRLQARKTKHVDAPIAGILDAWFVDVNQEVYEHQLLARIRNADLDAAVQSAQAALDQAEARIGQMDAQALSARLEVSRTTADQIRARNELDRIEKIYQQQKNLMAAGAIARLTFEKTETDYNAAKDAAGARDAAAKDAQDKAAALERDTASAKLVAAQQTAALAKAKDAVLAADLHSPADGVVLTRNVNQGESVEKSTPGLLTLAIDLTKLAVSLTPDSAVLARIRPGQHAFVRLSDAEAPGEVRELRGAEVIVEFTIPTPINKLGTAAQVRIVF